ncbi:MAG: hypothetical protein WDA08_04575 [Weeksellaceae bacterium]|nr:hypothetical protein [Acholeplasmataceae bacterium]
MSRDFKEKIREVFQEVKKEDFEQKVKEFNDLKNKKSNPYSIALGTANFEAYKSEYLNRVNSPYSDKKAIIQSLKNKTRKLLEKRGDIYNQTRLGYENTIFLVDPFDRYLYYTKKHEVIELMKFEEYLIEQENNKIETDKLDETKKENDKPDKIKKELHHFFNQIDNERKLDFLNELKELFPTEIGLSIRAIIEILKENNMLIIGTREFKAFFKELKDFFDRNIGSYQSINDEIPDDIIKETILLKLKPLIDKYKQS